MKYRIVKITYEDGLKYYYIQKRFLKLFWVYCTKLAGYDTVEYIKFGALDDAKKYVWFKDKYKASTTVVSKEIMSYD